MNHVSESVAQVLQDIRVHPIKVIQATTTVFGVSEPVIVSKDRHKTIWLARAACCLVMRRQGFSFPEIARTMQRDHTTIMSACRTGEKLERTDEQFKRQVELVADLIRPKYLKLRIEEDTI